MRMKALLMTVLYIVLGLSVTSDGFAAIYKYVDKDGMIYFADNLQSIPEQFRAAAKIVSGEAKEDEKHPANQNHQKILTGSGENEIISAGAQEKSFIETGNKRSFGSRALVSAIIVVSALFAFVILGILDTDHKKAVKIARVVVLWGVSVYLLYAHAKDVVSVFSSIGTKIEHVQQQSEDKGKKAAKAVKGLSTLVEQSEKVSSADPAAEPEKKE